MDNKEYSPPSSDVRFGVSESRIPVYVQLEQAFEAQIRSGALKPNDRLPTEREICLQAGVSRMTVRQALTRLVNKGLIRRQAGSGSYVNDIVITQNLSKLTSLTQELQSRGIHMNNRVLKAEEVLAGPLQRQALGLEVGDKVYRVLRLRSQDNAPVLLENVYLPPKIVPGFLESDLEHLSIYQLMEPYNARPMRAVETLTARCASPEEAELLKLPESIPVMVVERRSWDALQRPVELGQFVYRADRSRFVAELSWQPT